MRYFMTNSLAAFLTLLIGLLVCVDVIFFGSANVVFLGRKMLELLEWLAVWR
jgi:hypothetical protein